MPQAIAIAPGYGRAHSLGRTLLRLSRRVGRISGRSCPRSARRRGPALALDDRDPGHTSHRRNLFLPKATLRRCHARLSTVHWSSTRTSRAAAPSSGCRSSMRRATKIAIEQRRAALRQSPRDRRGHAMPR